MADVVLNVETANSEELISQGIKAFKLADYTTAVGALSRAVQILTEEHNYKDESLGVAYFYYGRALLELSREDAEPLGDVIPQDVDSDSDEDSPLPEETKKNTNAPNIETTDVSNPPQNSSESTDVKVGNGSSTNGEVKTGDTGDTSKAHEAADNEVPTEEEPTDLQVAWEVLELAKIIFSEQGESGKKQLAETFILLGEVALESENFVGAIDDIKSGLEIQKTLFENDNRTLAETHYKLGIALATDEQIDEAIQQYNISLDILKNKLEKLKENDEANKEEIKEIDDLIPEIEEKVSDMKNLKEETTNRLLAALHAKPEQNGPFDAGSSSKSVNDISHLIKRKRKDDEGEASENPAKRVSE